MQPQSQQMQHKMNELWLRQLGHKGHAEAQLQAVWKQILCLQKQWESHLVANQEGQLVAKQGGKQWHPVPKQCHSVAKQCHPIAKQEHRVGHLLEHAGISEYILSVVLGDEN